MSSSESGSENNFSDLSDFEYEFDDEGIKPFLFEPMYTEEEIEERIRGHECGEGLMDRNTGSGEKPCTCDSCVAIQIEEETLCCNDALKARLEKFNGKKCVTETLPFGLVCLEKDVLETALSNWNHLVGDHRNMCTKSYRFIAYRQYISWIYGRLGRNVRKRIPTCVLYKIRQTFPAPDNVYIPFAMKS